MELLLPPQIVSQLIPALREAGTCEIGGVMMGEHVGLNSFRVKEITIQRRGGTFAAFVRVVEEIIGPLRNFFHATKHDYTRFNYIGEWHSHHSFHLTPSGRDNKTMVEMLADSDFGARFVVLLLLKINTSGALEGGVTVYQADTMPTDGQMIQEVAPSEIK